MKDNIEQYKGTTSAQKRKEIELSENKNYLLKVDIKEIRRVYAFFLNIKSINILIPAIFMHICFRLIFKFCFYSNKTTPCLSIYRQN